jgi:hypothetical protein
MISKNKQKVIDKYVLIIKELFYLINESNTLRTLNYPILSIQIGFQIIHRVFEYILSKTQNIDTAYFYTQKSYYYYLEYIEQIYNSNISLNLNHSDAVLFVYKKTIIESQEKEIEEPLSTTHIKDITKLFRKIERIVNMLFFWEHTDFEFSFLRQMNELYLLRFLNKLDNLGDISISLVEFIQEKMVSDIKTARYVQFIDEIIKKAENNKLIVLCIDGDIGQSKPSDNNSDNSTDNIIDNLERTSQKGDTEENQTKGLKKRIYKKKDISYSCQQLFEINKINLFLEKYYTNKSDFEERFQKGDIGNFIDWFLTVDS